MGCELGQRAGKAHDKRGHGGFGISCGYSWGFKDLGFIPLMGKATWLVTLEKEQSPGRLALVFQIFRQRLSQEG